MRRIDTFTFRVNATERQLLTALAERLQRSQSDAVRLLIREAVRDLTAESSKAQPAAQPLAAEAMGGQNAPAS